MDLDNSTPKKGWVLYDDSCGFCSRWIPFWAPALRSRGYGISPLQSAWVRARLQLSDELLGRDLRLLLIDGSQVEGANVYRHIMRQIWWAYPLYLLASIPGLRTVFNVCYRGFATHRFHISSACGLSMPANPSGNDADSDIPHR